MNDSLVSAPLASDFVDRDAPPRSDRLPRRALSEVLWNIDWRGSLPLELTADGMAVHASTYDSCVPFVRDHYRAIFREDGASPFSTAQLTETKAHYYRIAGDFFEIKAREQTVGLVLGTPVDWSTYYIRSAAVLPEFQARHLVKNVLRFLFMQLAAARVERVEADTSPSNQRVIRLLTSLEFNVTGSVLTDRWGAHVRLTRFLNRDAESVFLRQFCAGA